MQYMLLIHQADAPRPGREGDTNQRAVDDWENLPDDEKNGVYASYQEVNQTPGVTPGVQLAPAETATTVRVQDGKTLITDGPFAELKDAIAGYMLFEADDLDAAIELASKVPAARLGGAIEVRPVMEAY